MQKNHKIYKIALIAIILLANLILTGCDEKYFDTRQQAENYKREHPGISESKIFVKDNNGNEISLDEIHDNEASKNMPSTSPAEPPITEGEVLKYEDTTAKTDVELFNLGNTQAVFNGGAPSIFKIDKPTHLSVITTYHWNDAKGSTPGTVSLNDQNGKSYGPWQAVGEPGQGGVTNASWKTEPNITLEPGTYTIIDSDPSTWAQNEGTGGLGMAWGYGYEE